MRGSGQRLPITLRFTRVLGTFSHTTCFPFSCALWACFSDRSVSGERSEPMGALMPHAALWVVQPESSAIVKSLRAVSMPHAALWVVQRIRTRAKKLGQSWFQCRTRLCGWCSEGIIMENSFVVVFQCRTRLCGWCSRHAAPLLTLEYSVSMPHAALWVVQQTSGLTVRFLRVGFQCRTRLCGWCSAPRLAHSTRRAWFQCRTRLCGWCSICPCAVQ